MSHPSQELGKLRWRCRRGMKELDVLLARYVDERFCSASNAEQEAFRRLLETPGPGALRLATLGSVPPPLPSLPLIERITAASIAER
jgi:antitoxin CptB